jgi:hypothetical protein
MLALNVTRLSASSTFVISAANLAGWASAVATPAKGIANPPIIATTMDRRAEHICRNIADSFPARSTEAELNQSLFPRMQCPKASLVAPERPQRGAQDLQALCRYERPQDVGNRYRPADTRSAAAGLPRLAYDRCLEAPSSAANSFRRDGPHASFDERLMNGLFSAGTSRCTQTWKCSQSTESHTEDIIMKKTLLLASIASLAAVTSTGSLADARDLRAAGGQALIFGHANDSAKRCNRDSKANGDKCRDRKVQRATRLGYERGMRVVPVAASAGQPGEGWRYFTHPAASRAVVISPQGEYFFSGGEGLSLVAVAQTRS